MVKKQPKYKFGETVYYMFGLDNIRHFKVEKIVIVYETNSIKVNSYRYLSINDYHNKDENELFLSKDKLIDYYIQKLKSKKTKNIK